MIANIFACNSFSNVVWRKILRSGQRMKSRSLSTVKEYNALHPLSLLSHHATSIDKHHTPCASASSTLSLLHSGLFVSILHARNPRKRIKWTRRSITWCHSGMFYSIGRHFSIWDSIKETNQNKQIEMEVGGFVTKNRDRGNNGFICLYLIHLDS